MARKKTTDEFVQEVKYNKFQNNFNEYFAAHSGEEYMIVDVYKNIKIPINVKHLKCNFIFPINPTSYKRKEECVCPKCFPDSTNYCVPFANDMYTIRPDMYKMLLHKEDGHKYKAKTKKKLWFVCPYCEKHIFASACNVAKNGLKCSNCNNSGLSYAERLMNNILNTFLVDYNCQYSPDWISPYRYDFMFVYKGRKYIIEMDGSWHYENNVLSGITLKESQERDEYKDKMAKEHGYIVIRIDCNYNTLTERFDYIVKNIEQSVLNTIFDFSKIDFMLCDKNATEPILQIVADKWNSGVKNTPELMKLLNIPYSTMREYLYKASELGFIKESIREIKMLNNEYRQKIYGHYNSIKVLCNETGEIFDSISEADRKYHADIGRYFRGKSKTSGTLPDGTRLTWTKLN